ncbi:MAG: ATP-binding protein [Desulfobacterales bacterium]|nr:ATP-binding protein [Desulfobacterales bacterium]
MNNSESFIGKVRSVTGSTISIELDEDIGSTLPIIEGILYRVGQIGSFIKIPFGYVDLFGVVTQAESDAIPEKLIEQKGIEFGSRWIKATLIGERIGRKFERGVVQFPIADDEVHLVTTNDLKLIYGGFDEEKSIIVGQVSASEGLSARVDIDKLVNRHCAILGSTGSGKSNTVSVVLETIATKTGFNNSRILLIDPHGEYGGVLKSHSQIFKVGADKSKDEKELYIPYWALTFQEFIKSFPGKLNEKQEEYIREKVLEKKIASSKKLSPVSKEEAITADSPIPFSIKQLWFELDDFERQTFQKRGQPETNTLDKTDLGDAEKLKSNKYTPAGNGGASPFMNNSAQGILGFLNLMRNRLLDHRYKFLYKLDKLTPNLRGEIESDIDQLIKNWIGTEKPITILDLSSIPSEVMSSTSGSLLSIIYEFIYWGQNLDVGGRQTPILFVLEEAHSYLKSGENSISSRIVQKIAKEGRKYGAGLLLVTQRPSELDETVLSQCGSVIALRMTNSNDRGHIKSAVEDSLSDLVELLPSLRTGEGLIMGECVKLPMRTKFSKAKASKSTDPLASEQWKNGPLTEGNYQKVIIGWRNNEFS